MRMKAACGFFLTAVSHGGASEEQAYSMPDTKVIELPTASNGVDYELYVYEPPTCREANASCPVVYLLDAEYSFPLAAAMIDHLSGRGRIKPVVAISIAYQDKTQYRLNRTRDYTPADFPTGGYGPEYQKHSGGGPNFLEILERQILPAAEAAISARVASRALVGHSYGGLFAAYAWNARPHLFDDYIIVSPSLWYAEGKYLAETERTCAENKSGKGARFILEVGAYEEQPQNGRAMVSDLSRFNDLLKSCGARKTETYFRVFEDETHASIFPAALSTGLRKLFGAE